MEHSGTALFRVPYPKFLHILLYKIGACPAFIKPIKTKKRAQKIPHNHWNFPCSRLVEARGVEPLSENHLPMLSTSVFCALGFPPRSAHRQAMRFGIPKIRDQRQGVLWFTFTAHRRLIPGRGAPGSDGRLN